MKDQGWGISVLIAAFPVLSIFAAMRVSTLADRAQAGWLGTCWSRAFGAVIALPGIDVTRSIGAWR